ncbi:hypothetical protein PCCS19_53530 [Paenibacillus sp. CCS19]|nr:hypothetical protein PCCS19_53530 [Paenibacillus cellulosilyticus]
MRSLSFNIGGVSERYTVAGSFFVGAELHLRGGGAAEGADVGAELHLRGGSLIKGPA